MTRNHKTLIGAGLVIIVLLGGYFGVRAYRASKSAVPPPVSESVRLSSLDAAKINRIEIPGSGLRLEHKGSLWELTPAPGIELDQNAVQDILWTLSFLSANRIIEEDPADLSVYGLDQGVRLVVTDSDGEQHEYLRGALTPSRSEYYLQAEGDPRVYVVSAYSANSVFFTLNNILDKTLLPSLENIPIRRMILEGDQSRIEIVEKGDFKGFVSPFSTHIMTFPYPMPRAVNAEDFPKLVLAPLSALSIREFVDMNPVSLAPYGLDKPGRIFIQTGGESYDLYLGAVQDGFQYAMRSGGKEVFTVDSLESLFQIKPFALIDKFALIVSIDLVDSFAVSGGERPLSAEIKRRGEEAQYFLNGKEAEEKSFKAFYQAAIGLLVDAEFPRGSSAGAASRSSPADTEITIAYNLNEPPGQRASIRLIPYNRDFYVLNHNGIEEFLVNRRQVGAIYTAADGVKYKE